MWFRGVIGIVLCLIGAVWVAQGTGAIHGSGMSGHGQYTVLGAFVIAAGLVLVTMANRHRSHREKPTV